MSLMPYGSVEHACNIAKVGKAKSPLSLAEMMPSVEIAAKVGVVIVPASDGETRRVRRHSACS